jgi:hypothetical protein
MTTRNLKEKLEELNLAMGMTHRGSCPVCGRHNTFTVSNDSGTLLYNCYAHSCNLKGTLRVNMSVEDLKNYFANRSKQAQVKSFVLPEYVIYDDEAVSLYAGQYALDHKYLDLRFDVREMRVVFPIVHDGVMVDAIGRSTVGATPKWKRYGEARTAYVIGKNPVAVVVEDAVSAAVAQTLGGTGFALLGTNLLTEHLDLLRKYDSVIVALDPDARKTTVTITRELKSNGIKAVAFPLYDDLKYREEDDVTQLKFVIETVDQTWN